MNLEEKCKALIDEYRNLKLQCKISDEDKIRIDAIDEEVNDIVDTYRIYAYLIANTRFEHGAKYPADRYFPTKLQTPTNELLDGNGAGIMLLWDGVMVLTVTFAEIRVFFAGGEV